MPLYVASHRVIAQSRPSATVISEDGSTSLQIISITGLNTKAAQLEAIGKAGNPSTIKRRAWCERDTLYTEFGAYSLILDKTRTIAGPAPINIWLAWKQHKNEKLVAPSEQGRLGALLSTFRALCPQRLEYVILHVAQPTASASTQIQPSSPAPVIEVPSTNPNVASSAVSTKRAALLIGNTVTGSAKLTQAAT